MIAIKSKIREFIHRFKQLNGDPHYVALGMAIGVFVSITPTIPFHTLIALAIAFVCRASKAAAAIGVWFSNPVTIPAFYYGSYKVGTLTLGISPPFNSGPIHFSELLDLGLELTAAMVIGGVIIAVVPSIAAYWITRRIMISIRSAPADTASNNHPTT